ncbi:hypothetical protein GCM10023115_14610 [Pontixanthobacter gangjinensis]|uniref:DUF3617 family protein n=1 Tax=Pontixanthobacter gangjinensis TaxID=1028742 RepID=A0A6I4SPE0_9SPHN|nr:DUF3617 domain-containing protein [Pontixanthobacter gangjinensis]MXO56707.1 DUF3617 family protein [Pontixanthobacter gangjinensis]
MRIVIVPALALVLASCGNVSGGNDEVAMEAGKWSNTMVIEKFDMPGAPPEAAGMFAAMVGQEQTTETCMTKEDTADAAKKIEEMATGSIGEDGCTSEKFSMEGGKIDGKVTCTNEGGGSGVMTIDGTHSSTEMAMTMTADIKDPSMPGGTASMIMKMSGKRLGNCDG